MLAPPFHMYFGAHVFGKRVALACGSAALHQGGVAPEREKVAPHPGEAAPL